MARGGDRGNQYTKVAKRQNDALANDGDTAERIAKEHLPQIFKMKTCGQTKTTEPYLQVRLLLKVEEQIAKEAEAKLHLASGGDRRSEEFKKNQGESNLTQVEPKKRAPQTDEIMAKKAGVSKNTYRDMKTVVQKGSKQQIARMDKGGRGNSPNTKNRSEKKRNRSTVIMVEIKFLKRLKRIVQI